MAEMALKIGGGIDPKRPRDGDIIRVFNQRFIRCRHAEVLCRQNTGFDKDGYRPDNSLLRQAWYENVAEFRCERVSKNVMNVINQRTLEVEVRSNVPNEFGRVAFVDIFFRNRLAFAKHIVFGTPGAEVYFTGRSFLDNATMTLVWNRIESMSAFREVNFTRLEMGKKDEKDTLFIAINDVSDAVAEELHSSVFDVDGNLVKKRKNWVDWQNDLSLNVADKTQIQDKGQIVDIRDRTTWDHKTIVKVRA